MTSQQTTLSNQSFAEMIREAASDPGGDPGAPRFYAAIQSCLKPEETGDRAQRAGEVVQFVGQHLSSASRLELAMFLAFVDEAELLNDSSRVRDSFVGYINDRLEALRSNAPVPQEISDLAVFALRRGAGLELKERWLQLVRAAHSARPSWTSVDLLFELLLRVPDAAYSVMQFRNDLSKLSSRSTYLPNLVQRRTKWARAGLRVNELQVNPTDAGAQEALPPEWWASFRAANGGQDDQIH